MEHRGPEGDGRAIGRPPEISIATYRVLLGLLVVAATWVDPKVGGKFHLDAEAGVALAMYLGYAIAIWVALSRHWITVRTETNVTTVGDVLVGLVVAAVTNRAAAAYSVFLAFGVLAAGARGDSFRCLCVTAASVLGYIGIGWGMLGADFSLMRPVYLGVMGLMLAAVGRSYRDYVTSTARSVAALEERNRIARTLHDGYLQTIAGATLQLEAVRQAFARGMASRGEAMLAELRRGLDREHDGLRAYVRALAGRPDEAPRAANPGPEPDVRIAADVELSLSDVEWIASIVREGLINVRSHARATAAEVRVHAAADEVRLTIADDGVGFPPGGRLPWSIESRVREAGGSVALARNGRPGTMLIITLPFRRAESKRLASPAA